MSADNLLLPLGLILLVWILSMMWFQRMWVQSEIGPIYPMKHIRRFVRRFVENNKYACHRKFMRDKFIVGETRPSYIKVLDSVAYGATLDWGFSPARLIRFRYRCGKCGEEFVIGNKMIYGDKKLHPDKYDADGWPLDDNGMKLPMIRN